MEIQLSDIRLVCRQLVRVFAFISRLLSFIAYSSDPLYVLFSRSPVARSQRHPTSPNRYLSNRSLMAPGRPSGTVSRVGVGIKHRLRQRGSRLTISPLPSRTDELVVFFFFSSLPKGRIGDVERAADYRSRGRRTYTPARDLRFSKSRISATVEEFTGTPGQSCDKFGRR